MKYNWLLLGLLLLGSCQEEVLPKPKGQLRLDYPEAQSQMLRVGPYGFQYNPEASPKMGKNGGLTLNYTDMDATVYLTYKPVEGNLKQLLSDAQKLSYEHAVKADNILEQPFVNPDESVYGMFYEVAGNAASQAQFYATDSLRHFVTGSLYFYAKPNYDSIYPAAVYLQKDMRRIMESLRWVE